MVRLGLEVGKERMNLHEEVPDLSVLRPSPRVFPYNPSYCRETVVFLDFDGVLHPEERRSGESRVFDEADRIEALLDDYPEVSIVFATSWQMLCGFARLQTVFRADYRERVIGGTDQLHPESYSTGRGLLAQRWMARHAPGRRWISLDDDLRAFEYRDQNLLWCSEGIYGEQADKLLRAWLETNSTDIQHFIASRLPDDPSEWTVRDAVAAAPESGGWVNISRVPGGLLELHAPDGPDRNVWALKQWRDVLQRWCSERDRNA